MAVMENQRIEFASTTENLSLVESVVNDVCEGMKVDEDYYGNILVALTEAVTNAIQHGNKYDANKSINLAIETAKDEIKFTVQDQGDGFDFDNLPDPTDPVNIEKPNGRGIFLMRHLADEVEFHNEGRSVELNFKVKSN